MAIGRLVGVLPRGAGLAAGETGRNTATAWFLPDGDGHGWLSPIVWSAPAARCVRGGVAFFCLAGGGLARGFAGFAAVPCGLGVSDCRAVFLKSPICECWIHILGWGALRAVFGVACGALVLSLFLRGWLFLAFLSVCWRCLWLYFCGVGLSLLCYRSISDAPVRGGTYFLCRRKESKQRKRAHTASP